MMSCSETRLFTARNFFPTLVFMLVKSLFGLAQRCGLNPPLDPQAAGLSIEGRAVPDYGAPFNFLAVKAGQVSAVLVAPASCRHSSYSKN